MSRLADAATHQTASLETSISRQVCRACLAGGLLALLCAGAVPASAQGKPLRQRRQPLDLSSATPVGCRPAANGSPSRAARRRSAPIRPILMCPTIPASSRPSGLPISHNPNLTQFAKDGLKRSNDEVTAGKAMYSREARCWANRGAGLSAQSGAADLLPADAREGGDDLADGSAGASRLSQRAALAEIPSIMVRRVGRALRRRHPGGRHHRPEHPDFRRQLPHPAQRQAAT